ncbi:hypothetical protein BJY04DRAFT_216001 [Aspergillus karnatakaensis]|uniref:protein-histidine N-methyltransferase n=1 Tax=Aspergillus karnatakaensis TaxID=1810916 RepID=UPI003CCCCF6A
MASSFSFGFSGDDIDIDDLEIHDVNEEITQPEASSTVPELVKAQRHELDEWLSTLPSQISYNKLGIQLPADAETSTSAGNEALTVVRRDVFDIRAQLMVEDSAEEQNGELIAGLEKGDITPNFYEGGFKTWECSIDLAGLLAAEGLEVEDRHIIELGSGTAVPSLALFAQLLSQTNTEPTSGSAKKRTHFTFADYNSAVLRLVTLPNLLLTWNHFTTQQDRTASTNAQHDSETETQPSNLMESEDEELDMTPSLIERFQNDLTNRGITISFISGAWSPSFVELVFSSPALTGYKTLILASETIYSPASLVAFSETLLALLQRPSVESRALIAAKKVYFGVGGGIDEFLAVLRGVSAEGLKVEERLDVKSAGVGRVILEIGLGP